MTAKNNHSQVAAFFQSVIVLISRWIKIAPNFSLVGAFSFNQKRWWSALLPIVIFDLVKGGFYSGFIFTYLGFSAYYLLGRLAKTWKTKLLLLPAASFLFFLISNLGVWIYWYQPTWQGLLKTYTLALPFYRNTFISDLVFGSIFIGAGVFAKKFEKKSVLKEILLPDACISDSK